MAYDGRKTFGSRSSKKSQYMRVIMMELARIADHLVCNSVIGVDTGALTGFTYVFQDREKSMTFMSKFVVLE
jgi:NADH-quinone oxidoreductase subunit D